MMLNNYSMCNEYLIELRRLAQIFAFFRLKDPNLSLYQLLYLIYKADVTCIREYGYSFISTEFYIEPLFKESPIEHANTSCYKTIDDLDEFSEIDLEILESVWTSYTNSLITNKIVNLQEYHNK